MFNSLFLLFISITIVAYLLLSHNELSDKYIKVAERLTAYGINFKNSPENRNLFERAMLPFFKGLGKKLFRLTHSGREDYYKKKLLAAGEPSGIDANKFITLKAISFFSMAAIGFLITLFKNNFLMLNITIIFVCAVAGYYIPDFWIDNLIAERKKSIRKGLPDTIDSLVICIEAGLGFDAALSKIIRYNNSVIAQEFAKVLYEIQVGIERKIAFRNLSERTDIEDLKSFANAISQAELFGISIGRVLRTQAKEIRNKGRQYAEEKAQKANVKIIFPVVLCIFPAMFVIILGPAAIRIYTNFFS